MEIPRRGDRHEDRFIINNWKDFRTFMLPLTFPEQLHTFSPQQIGKFWTTKLDELLKNTDKLFYLCRPQTQQYVRNIAIQLLKEDKRYCHELGFEYEHLFLGNQKQLLIYINTVSVTNYLRKYRPPDQYVKIRDKVNKIEDKVDALVIKRNIAISYDSPFVEIDAFTDEIEKISKKQLEQPLQEYKTLLNKIFADFKAQDKREQFTLFITRRPHIEFIHRMCQEYELYLHKKYVDGPKNEKYVDMEVLKTEPAPFDVNGDNYSYDEQDQPQTIVKEKSHSENLRSPKDLDFIQLIKLEPNTAQYRVMVPSCGLTNQIDSVVVVNGKGQDTVIDVKKGQQQINVVIKSYQQGVCKFTFMSQNSVGRNYNPRIVKVAFNVDYNNKVQTNKRLYLLGQSKDYLIPNLDPKTKSDKAFLQTTNDQFLVTLSAMQVTIGTSLFLCDQNGVCAGWGQNYYHNEEGQANALGQLQKASNPLNMSLYHASAKVDPPSIFDNSHHIRKISCGQYYLLACTNFGEVWSMGYNCMGQLGLGHVDKKVRTDDLMLVSELSEKKIWIVDVKATLSGSSIALDVDGKVYRWGFNQAEVSSLPVLNSYGDIINYKIHPLNQFGQPTPCPINKRYIFDPVIQIHAGKNFFLVLTTKNQLYGWGKYDNLGLGAMKSILIEEIYYLCNPIQLMKGVRSVQAGDNHAVVTKDDGSVWGWGDSSCFLPHSQQFIDIPTEIKCKTESLKTIACGPAYTVFHYQRNEVEEIEIVGCKEIFKAETYHSPGRIKKIICGKGIIGALIEINS